MTELKNITTSDNVARNCAVDIATHYGLGGTGIESRCGARFSAVV